MKHNATSPWKKAFSLLEVLIVVSAVGILGSLSVVMISDTVKNSNESKLTSDLNTLNTAVSSYLASNGDLSAARNASEVIAKLKTVADAASADMMNSYRGGFLDRRVEPVMQTEAEAAKDAPRVYWDASRMKFVLATSGGVGIKSFRLNDALATGDPTTESRDGPMALATRDNWIWDYTEAVPTFAAGPSTISVTAVSSPAPAPTAVPSTPPPPAGGALAAPQFSTPSGTYPISDYDLTVTIADPNPAGISQLFYRIGFGTWVPYGGTPLTVPPQTLIQAQAHPSDPTAYSSSTVSEETYFAGPLTLDPPTILTDADGFGLFNDNDITVTLIDTNAPGIAIAQYRINGSPWLDYTGAFVLRAADYLSGAEIEAKSISAGSPYYLSSTTNLRFLTNDGISLTGSASGEFHEPTGGSGMLTNLASGNRSSYFEWGDGSSRGNLSESWLDFSGGAFGNISDGQQFSLGSLTYYNGTIRSGTGADTVDLDITLSLNVNGSTYNPYFDFTFDLINTPNSSDEIASADYVYLDDARSSRTIVFDDYEFEFSLEFGETTANGFSQFDEFHVIENSSASVNLYGTFNLLGPVSGSTANDPIKGGLVIADDPGTGSEADPIYQKLGYLDPEQYAKDLLIVAKEAREDADQAETDSRVGRDIAVKAASDIISKIADEKFFEAEQILQDAIIGAEVAQNAAGVALTAAIEAKDAAEKIRNLVALDPSVEDIAIKATEYAIDAQDLANLASSNAQDAVAALNSAQSAWSNVINQGSSGSSEAFAQYLADVAAAAAASAKVSRDNAVNASDDAVMASDDTIKKIGEGKYHEAEILLALAGPAALASESYAFDAEQSAAQARTAANDALAIASTDSSAANEASDAVKSADDAEAYALTARATADTARTAATNATALWADILANGASTNPVEFATYLADVAKAAEDAAKAARDTAKNRRDASIKSSQEAIKKAKEGKFGEAQHFAALTDTAAAEAEAAAQIAEAKAVEARSAAVQAGVIAASVPDAGDAYTASNVSASNAEIYGQEARSLADEASTSAADANAAANP